MRSVFTALLALSFSLLAPFLSLSLCLFGWILGLFDPSTVASLFGCSSGCSPDPAPSSGTAHARSVVYPDPPCPSPPGHVSVRHIIVLTCLTLAFAFSLFLDAFLALFSHILVRVLPEPLPLSLLLFSLLPEPVPLSPVSLARDVCSAQVCRVTCCGSQRERALRDCTKCCTKCCHWDRWSG